MASWNGRQLGERRTEAARVADGEKEREREKEAHLDGLALADLDVLAEHARVVVAQLERREGHDGRDRAKVEDGLVAQERQVVKRVGRVAERIDDHGVEDPEALVGVLGLDDVRQLLERLLAGLGAEVGRREDGPRPEAAALVDVLLDVSQDVGLLQEQAHRVGQHELVGQERPLLLSRHEQAREALADEAGNVAARGWRQRARQRATMQRCDRG